MLVSPTKFDSNEWFIVVSLLLTYSVMFVLPRRFPHSLTFIILLFSMTYVQVTDHFLAGINLDLYDINDTEKFEWFDLIAWFLYPPFGYIYVYFFDKWSIKYRGIFWYILLWTFIAIGIELLALKMDLFTYINWNISYSFPVYLLTLSIYLLFFIWMKNDFYRLKSRETTAK